MDKLPAVGSEDRKPTRWLLFLGFLGVVFVVLFGRPLLKTVFDQPAPPPMLTPIMLPALPEVKLPPAPEAVAKPHLDRIEQEAERAIEEHLKVLDTFFADAKKGTRKFAEEAVGWSSKWRIIVDCLPWNEGDSHAKFIRSNFERHIFKANELQMTVDQVVRSYIDQVRSLESKMLVALRADVADFPTAYLLARLNDKELQAGYDQTLALAVKATYVQLGSDIRSELVSIIGGEVLVAAAVRLGVSAGILGAGATSGWLTFGIGFVVGLIIDTILG